MQDPASEIAVLQAMVHSYIQFFLVIDVLFPVVGVLLAIAIIKFVATRKKLKESDEYLSYTIRGQEEERSRISRELHDTIAQDVRYALSLSERKDAQHHLAEIAQLLKGSLLEVRSLSYNLAPPDITKDDIIENIKDLCAECNGKNGVSVRLSIIDGTDASFLTADEALHLYRIAQEACTNSIKHSKSAEIAVLVRNETAAEEKGLYLFISDDGVGFDTARARTGFTKHYGLKGMQNRAQLIGALLTVRSSRGEGTLVSVFMPNSAKTTI